MIAIYGLLDPRDGEVRYVGQTNAPERRLKQHLAESRLRKDAHLHQVRWIRSLLRDGYTPQLRVLATATPESADAVETEVMQRFSRLTNATLGGKGTRGYRHTDAARLAIAGANRQRPVSATTRELIGSANKGRQTRLGCRHSDETKEKISVAKRGVTTRSGFRLTDNQKRKIGNTNRGRKQSPEHVQKRLAAIAARRINVMVKVPGDPAGGTKDEEKGTDA